MLDRSSTLPDGTRVRIRLPHGSDRPGLRALHDDAGAALDELELARLLRVDPRRRCALVATAWAAGTETIVGFGACDLPAGEPEVVVADASFAPELRELLWDALRARSSRVA